MVDERRGLLDLPSLISDELLSRVPGLKEAFRAVDSALQLWFPTTTIATGPMRAVHIASSLAIKILWIYSQTCWLGEVDRQSER